MSQIKEAGPYTIIAGLHRGAEHIYVTHRETGKQWVSKNPMEHQNLDLLVELIEDRITKFDHTKTIGSCDTRFWLPVRNLPRSDFDALCFIGD